MATEWRTAKIEDVAERVAMGPFGSSIKVETFVPEGVPVISGQHLHSFKVNDEVGFKFISPEHAKRLKNANVQRGDVIFTHAGNIGQVAYVPEDSKYERYVISQRQFYMRCDHSKIIPEFVVAYFKTAKGQHNLLANTSQVGVPSIARPVTYLRTIEIPLPSLAEQNAIARILGTLGKKIELNRSINETLEAIARSLFNSWFVDFDPVRAKYHGRDSWLPKPIADLFPDRLEESELGHVPAGWEIGTLADYAKLNPEVWSKNTYPEEIEYVDLANTKWGRIESTTRHGRQDAPSRAQRVLRLGDTIIGTVRPGNGSYARVSDQGLTGSTGFAVLRPLDAANEEVVYLAATAPENIERLAHLADGAAYPAVRSDVVLDTVVVRATTPVVKAFAGVTKPLLEKAAQNERESRTLTALRDTLLPKLLSGEIRIVSAKRHVEAAT